MNNSILSKLKKCWRLISYGFLLLKIGGIAAFLLQFKRLIYSRYTQIGYSLEIDKFEPPKNPSEIKYILSLATQDDMKEILKKAKSESKSMVHKLIFRKILYDDGYHNCYIARTKDTKEICSLTFTIFPWEYKRAGGIFKDWIPEINQDEALLEGVYTFEKFRGYGLHATIVNQQLKLCKENSIKCVKAYIVNNNEVSLKSTERMGFKQFEKLKGVTFLFRTRTVSRPINNK